MNKSMAILTTACWCSFLTCFVIFGVTEGCGTATHIEISHRAQDTFLAIHSKEDYGKLLLNHQDAFEAGSPFPDAFYDSICFKGKYHNISEDTHWTPFLNASVNYIRKHFPVPWNEATQKLVVFLLGVMSHQIADVSWHGLGIDQGFLDAMGAINFHGSFDSAHSVGDFGGDIMTMFEMNTSYMPFLTEWYVPVDDLYNIYIELYGTPSMPKEVILACTLELYAERFGEKLAVSKLYADYAAKSPFLVDELSDYFLGGIDDMAVWTQNVWQKTILMLENGTEVCTLDHNPLFIQCRGEKQKRGMKKKKSSRKPERNGYFQKRTFTDIGSKDMIIEKSHRGFRLRPGLRLKEELSLSDKQREATLSAKKTKQQHSAAVANQKAADAVYTLNSTYAKLGWSMAVGDLDMDGNEDVVIGAPGYRQGSSPQDGAVFVLFGTDKGLPLTNLNLQKSADVILHGLEYVHGRLGSSVAVLDINQDGLFDIAAGAPSSGSNLLTYNGSVEVYYGVGHRTFVHNMTVGCVDHYCNIGWSLTSGDINADGFPDLLIGSPFAGGKGEQRGVVTAVLSSSKYRGNFVTLSVSELPWAVSGSQNYSWFGYSLTTKTSLLPAGDTMILVSEPTWRMCILPNCSFSGADTQSVGKLTVFHVAKGKPISVAFQKMGTSGLQSYGSSTAIGTPYPDKTPVLAVGAPGQAVVGSIASLSMTFPQTGAVFLYNLSNPQQSPLAVFAGDRRYSRFGHQIMFSDINGDGFDDLLIGAPLRTDDVTEEIYGGEEGAGYIFYGGATFPTGNSTTSNCPTMSLITPCPASVASMYLTFGEDKARFGAQFAVVKSKTKMDVLVTAKHSSQGARLSGAVAVYSFPRV